MTTAQTRTINQRYSLVTTLGKGSFGVVYEAIDAADPSRPVALKVMTRGDEAAGGAAAIELGEEFRQLANLWHPNLARVIDFGIDRASGEPFYTMELIRGRDFVTASRGMEGSALLCVVSQALRALAYVHGRQIVHGDLKPENLLVKDPASGEAGTPVDQVKLLDFGLSRSSGDRSRSAGGTALYLAPELARGEPPTAQSDLYAFGALVYHAACGQPPFTGSVDALIEAHRSRAPRPPRALERGVPDALDAVVMRLLAKDPQDRYATARETLETLARFSGLDLPLETPQTRAVRLTAAPFVGRDDALATLRTQVDHLVSGRVHTGLILITGEAGIGKSRLARELSHHLQIYGVEVFRAACPREGGGAFRPLVEPLARLLATAPQALRGSFESDVGRIVPGIVVDRSASRAMPGQGDETAKGQLVARLCDFLMERARSPIALLLDDLQWADQATLDLLAALTERLRTAVASGSGRILIVAMARDSEGGRATPVDDARVATRGSAAHPLPAHAPAAREPSTRESAGRGSAAHAPATGVAGLIERARPLALPLVPLSADHIEAIARGLTASGELADALARRVREVSGGNPFFAEEFVRLAEEGGGNDLAPGGQTPTRVVEILAARLARLPQVARSVVEALALLGRPVRDKTLAAVVRLSDRDLASALDDLSIHRVARPEDDAPGTWGLVHLPLAQVVEGAMPPERRRDFHERIAVHLEVLVGEGRDHLLAEVAHHFREAGRSDKAQAHTLGAARRNAWLFDHAAARTLFLEALKLTEKSDLTTRRTIAQELAVVCESAGLAEEAMGHLATARNLAVQAGDLAAELDVIAHLGRRQLSRGDPLRALRVLKEGADRAVLPDLAPEYASICRLIAMAFLDSARHELAREWCRKGLEALGVSEEGAGPGLTLTLGHVLAAKGKRTEALETWERAATMADRRGEPTELLGALLAQSDERLARGESGKARELAQRALDIARHRRDLPRQTSARGALAEIDLFEGQVDSAQEQVDESRKMAERVGYLDLQHEVLWIQAAIERARGNYPRSLEHIWGTFHGHRKGLALEDRSQAFRERMLGATYLDLCDFKKSRSFLRRARARAEQLGDPALLAACILSSGTLELREKRLARAEADLREAFGMYERLGHKPNLARALVLLAELTLLRGEPRKAAERAHRALAIARGCNARPLALLAGAIAGRADAFDPDRRAGALELLRESATGALALRMPELACRACHALGQVLVEDGKAAEAREAYRDAVLVLQEVTTRLAVDVAAAYTADEQRSRLLSEWAGLKEIPACAPSPHEVPRAAELVSAIARITRCLDLDTLLAEVVDASLSLSGAERGGILLMDSPSAQAVHPDLVVKVARAAGGKPLAPSDLAASRTIVEKAFGEARSVIANDTAAEAVSPSASIMALDLKSVLAVPLAHGGDKLGLLYLDSHSVTRSFSPLDLELLSLLAQHAAIALENVNAYRQIETLKGRLQSENLYLREEIQAVGDFGDIVGQSPAIAKVMAAIDRVAPTDTTVLVRGETGTGKELVARAIHARSTRATKALIKVNLAALPPDLIESELFGHERGAFTGAMARRVGRFELAHEGTIFLDEIGELPPPVQVKLLRVLQEREFERLGGSQTIRVDCRVIAATNRDLEDGIKRGVFRDDLFYRLSVFPIVLPPLRMRGTDVLSLAAHHIARMANKLGRPITAIDESTRRLLLTYAWPGNVRELANVIERACILARGSVLTADTLPEGLGQSASGAGLASVSPGGVIPEEGLSLADALREAKIRLVREALARTGGNQAQAARLLKIQRSNLNRLIKELQIA